MAIKTLNGVQYQTELLDQTIVYPTSKGSKGVQIEVPFTSSKTISDGSKVYLDTDSPIPNGWAIMYKIENGKRVNYYLPMGRPNAKLVVGSNISPLPHVQTQAEKDALAKLQAGNNPFKDTITSLANQAAHPLDTLKNVVDNIVTASKKVLSKAEEGLIFGILAMFKPAMDLGLKQKGVSSPPSNPKHEAVLFFHKVIAKQSLEHADDTSATPAGADVANMAIDLGSAGATEGAAAAGESYGIPPAVSKGLVKMIIEFFKSLINKKKDKTLSAADQKLADTAAPVQDNLAAVSGGPDSNGTVHAVDANGVEIGTVSPTGNVVVKNASGPGTEIPAHRLNIFEKIFPNAFKTKHPDWYKYQRDANGVVLRDKSGAPLLV